MEEDAAAATGEDLERDLLLEEEGRGGGVAFVLLVAVLLLLVGYPMEAMESESPRKALGKRRI